MKELLQKSATELAAMIRDGKITSREAVDTHIARIEEVNPILNAVVRDRFEVARQEADAADARLKENGSADLPPFFGVPCTIKECFSFTGMPNSSGLVSRKNVIGQYDAPAVERIRNAGAIPMGVTNVPELCMWMETGNRVYGRTNNPYNPDHIVGGSSGGEGAIIAAGGSPFGLGSDIGGSIRMPAFFNGVFGHKPSGGLVPNSGQFPVASGDALQYLTTGPLCRKAEDIWPLVNLLKGQNQEGDGTREITLGNPDAVDLSNVTVVMVEGNGRHKVKADMVEALHRAGTALQEKGATLRTTIIPELKHSPEIWSAYLMKAGGPTFSEMLSDGRKKNMALELAKWTVGASDHTLPAILLALLERIPKMMPKQYEKFYQEGVALRKKLDDLLGENGVMLYPSYVSAAPKHYLPQLHPFSWSYTGILNVMTLPVTQTPLGLNNHGLPLGVQVAASHGNDHLTVACAKMLEEKLGGWAVPKDLR